MVIAFFRIEMAVGAGPAAVIDVAEFADGLEGCRIKRRLALKGVQHDPFEQVAEAHVLIVRECPEHFQKGSVHADASLNSVHRFCYQVTWITSRPNTGG